MANANSDSSVLDHINELVKEEEQLYEKDKLTLSDEQGLSELEVQLDQCWDLLRQRRALREFGRIRTRRRYGLRTSSRTTNSN